MLIAWEDIATETAVEFSEHDNYLKPGMRYYYKK
jgi:hypothetical protein